MPASICDPVSSALRLSLAADESQNSALLESRIYSSAKSVLLSKIEFEESGDYQSNVLDGLKSKYVVIRHKKPGLENKISKRDGLSTSQTQDVREDAVPKAKRILFPLERVQLGWQGAWAAGAGMHNVGNTCYLNSTLQALFHVPAFANWLVSESTHTEKCNQQEPCVICCMRSSLMATQKSGGTPVKPWQVYSKLRQICRHLTPGRQEDAHEFLRYLVEAMEKSYLSRFVNADKLDQYSKETTPLNQILGGYLRSTVRCLACHHLSTTYQHFQDLLLDIRKHSTLDEALDSFFSRERLEDLGYKCEACNKKVSATKQFFIERAPMVLCIALKRFSLVGGKLSKHIQFRKKISLNKYVLNKNSPQQLSYKLVSLVTHLGPSQNCGHYTALGQAPNTSYYQFDDSCVRPLPLSAVLGTNAYIMFFERDAAPDEPAPAPQPPAAAAAAAPSRDKSPLKLTFYRSEEKKPTLDTNGTKDVKKENPPIILNRTLSKTSDTNSSNSEPWVVKQNGEVEKVSKVSNGTEKKDVEKVSFVIKRSSDEIMKNEINDRRLKKKLSKSEGDIRNGSSITQRTPEKCITTSKLVKPPKSPLEKMEEQMNKNTELENHTHKNGSALSSKLVPYDSESSGDERSTKECQEKTSRKENEVSNGSRGPQPTRCASPQGAWTVSRERSGPLLSPSLNGVANIKKLNENPASGGGGEARGRSPSTSVSTLSPLSDAAPDTQEKSIPSSVAAPTTPVSAGPLASAAAARALNTHSHRGYGAPVLSWTGSQSYMNRQVFEERRDERKRAFEATDEMDRGRVKKVKKFHQYNRFNNDRNGYNPFQEKQNKQNWGGGFKYRNERRPPHHFHNKNYNNKYKRFNNRYNSGGGSHHYARPR